MVIYGVALLSICMLAGVFVGDLLGDLIGVQANVGGVGIAMLSPWRPARMSLPRSPAAGWLSWRGLQRWLRAS
jgi:hypothetical protein